MKKYATLESIIANALADEKKKAELFAELRKTFVNEAIQFDALKKSELMHLLQFIELEKALTNSKYTMHHDSNLEMSRATTVETRMFTLLDTHNKRALHIYSHDKTLDIVFSSDKTTKAKVAMIIEADYKSKEYALSSKKDTKVAKVAFDDCFNACKYALLIIESSAEQIQAMIDREKAKAE